MTVIKQLEARDPDMPHRRPPPRAQGWWRETALADYASPALLVTMIVDRRRPPRLLLRCGRGCRWHLSCGSNTFVSSFVLE